MANGSVEVNNPAEFLRKENGVFEVISPHGHVFHVTCRCGFKMRIREISEPKGVRPLEETMWRIRRVNRAVA
jgi:hypothetical protein